MKYKLGVNFLFIADIIMISASMIISWLLRFDGRLAHGFPDVLPYVLIASTIVKIISFKLFKLYKSLWHYAGIYELSSIIKASFVGNAIILGNVIVFNVDMPGSVFAIAFFIDIALVGGLRLAYRVARRVRGLILLKAQNPKKVLIVGGGNAGSIIIKELIMHPELKRLPVAVIDDDRNKIGKSIGGISVVGDRNNIVRTVSHKKIDEIVIAIPSIENIEFNKIYNECIKTHCKVKILSGVSQLIDESTAIHKIRDVDIEDLLCREPVNLDIGAIASYLDGQVVMVTGGGGSIGSELCRQIACFKPKRLILLDNYENSIFELQNELLNACPEFSVIAVIANIREASRLDSIFRRYRPDVVFHAAAHKHVPLMEDNAVEAIRNNIFGTLNLIDCSLRYEVKKFILISTDKAVNPSSVMGATKRAAEMAVQSVNRNCSTIFAAVRFGNVLGSNGSVIPVFKKQIARGGPVTVTHPEVTRYFMTIREAAQLVIEAGAIARGGEIFVLDMGNPINIHDLARTLIRLSGLEPDIDIKIVFTGLRPGEKMHEELFLAGEGFLSTRNDKIFNVCPAAFDKDKFFKDIEFLKHVINVEPDRAVEYLQTIVPDYKRRNDGN